MSENKAPNTTKRTLPYGEATSENYYALIAKATGYKSNENCLAGLRCPSCLSSGGFKINGYDWDDDGSFETNEDWTGGTLIKCLNCLHEATVDDFEEPVVTNEEWDRAEEILDTFDMFGIMRPQMADRKEHVRLTDAAAMLIAYHLALAEQKGARKAAQVLAASLRHAEITEGYLILPTRDT